jgi:hypothetical protein
MKLLLKIVAIFAVAGLILLLVLSYMENEHGLKTNASEVLRNIETIGNDAVQATENFLETSGIKDGAEKLIDQAAELIDGENADEPDSTSGPASSPSSSLGPSSSPDPQRTDAVPEKD